jgi:uncharacterized protein (TIGR00255 family)
MLYSMTGYGRSETSVLNSVLSVELKSLNGKQSDINMRMPLILKSYEIEIKNLIQKHLVRGSIDALILLKQHGGSKPVKVNTDLAKFYYGAIKQLSEELNEPTANALSLVLNMPDVISQSSDEISEADWAIVQACIINSCDALNKVRLSEGDTLQEHLLHTVNKIDALSKTVLPFEEARTQKHKAKLQTLIAENVGAENLDKNRLEQEIIYYLEKLDITEEKVRLAHHCNYFQEALANNEEMSKGKKLGFILQEIGREINTMGSKANDANIQKIVVQMKDELEKAKEQTLNVL